MEHDIIYVWINYNALYVSLSLARKTNINVKQTPYKTNQRSRSTLPSALVVCLHYTEALL